MKLITSILAITTAAVFAQGPLTPPGAPAPTMKTLDEIHAKVADAGEKRTPISSLPVSISTSGSYYLTKNLSPDGSGNGISITCPNVTLDLNGFTLDGLGSAQPGITLSATQNTTVRNGTITGWTGGIVSAAGSGHILEKLNVRFNAGIGISFQVSTLCQVRDCAVHFCGSHGIVVADNAVVTGNIVKINTGTGIRVEGVNAEIRDNTVHGNTSIGIHVLASSSRSSVEANSIKNNGTGLFVAGNDNSIRKNLITGNTSNANIGGAGNDFGPFGTAAASTNPNANIVY